MSNYRRNGVLRVFTALDPSEGVLEDAEESCDALPCIIDQLCIGVSNARTKSLQFFLSHFLLALYLLKNLRHLSFNLLVENARKLLSQ